ncbi:hypothetical protein VPNG_08906 [Cytospora leucostoma]|uniref:Uncharacterized protein n=1 Tax=Cytospora leucostoma TaxID=1230097 RepID=A0A423VWN1_9PEZI|nr:hypothetical protein VPNG_08906 [Cytospora leucostoma]
MGGKFHTALIAASASASLGTVKTLLDAGADVSLSDKNGLTALDHASKRGATEIVQVLLAYGAESTPASKRLACRFGHRDALTLLKDRGAPLDSIHDQEDILALDAAMRYSHFG